MARFKKFRFSASAGIGFETSYVAKVDAMDYSEYFDWDDIPEDELKEAMFHVEEACSDWALQFIESYIEEVD